jgi:hypothetical protein
MSENKEPGVIYVRAPEASDGPPTPILWMGEDEHCDHSETACAECVMTWWEDYMVYFHMGGGRFVSVDTFMMADRPLPTPDELAENLA